MPESPLVSIIIPTFNRSELLVDVLNSVLEQSYKNWECIVIDDGSTDDTEEVIQDYLANDSRFNYYKRPNDFKAGGCGARNYGLEQSNGVYINWFDSDDVMLSNHIESHVKAHLSNSSIDMTVSNAVIFKDQELPSGNWSNIKPKKNIIDEMIVDETLWPTNCVVWRRTILPSKPFNEDLSCSQEWTFHLEMVMQKKVYNILDRTTVKVRRHDNRIGGTKSCTKNNSIFVSRLMIMNLLKQNNKLTKLNEAGLLKQIFSSLRLSIDNNCYNLFFRFYGRLFNRVFSFKNYKKVLRVLFIASPIYLVFKKGEKLFHV